MATMARSKLFVVEPTGEWHRPADPQRRDRWISAIAIGIVVAMLGLLAGRVDPHAPAPAETGPSLLLD